MTAGTAVQRAALALLLGIAATGCNASPQRGADVAAASVAQESTVPVGEPHVHHDAHAPAAVQPLAGTSVYQLDDVWADRYGAERQLAELRGRPQVIAMVYTNCGSACPRIVQDMKRLEGEFPDLGFVLISIDPERDTAGQLDSFARATRMGDNWTLLRGSEESIATLAAVLGVRYRRISETDFMHSNVITLLDAGGSIVYRQEALGETDGTLDAVRKLLERSGRQDR